MPFIAQDLIAENPIVVVTTPGEFVHDALQRMVEHDFSQLPVIDDENRPLGMVTSESILRALTGFGVNLDDLRVEHAYVRADTYRGDADLFELLDRLRDTYAVLIVDGDGRLIGIVTNYDTADYFRRRSEDIMLIEDIETMVKDYIQVAFTNESGEVDESELEEAIQRISDNGEALREKFERALIHYLTLQGGGSGAKPDNVQLEQVYEKHFRADEPVKSFDDLTLYDFIEMLLDKSRWSEYQSVFHLDRGAVRNLLDRVRDTRNALAHFRGEITAAQRDHLRFSANWLAQYQEAVSTLFVTPMESSVPAEISETLIDYKLQIQDSIELSDLAAVLPIEDEADPRESRYAPLAIWLQNHPPDDNSTQLTFEQVEEIIGGELPKSAYSHRAWWANDSVGHVQSQQWLEVGWKVNSINMSEKVVRFARIKERQKAYIDFFSKLLADARKSTEIPVKDIFPVGLHYQTVAAIIVDGRQVANFAWSFVRGSRFRIELYIDTGNKDGNKDAFDTLYATRSILESSFGDKLSWERLSANKASRIAYYRPGTITDNEAKLQELGEWAVVLMEEFHKTLAQPAEEALKMAMHGEK